MLPGAVVYINLGAVNVRLSFVELRAYVDFFNFKDAEQALVCFFRTCLGESKVPMTTRPAGNTLYVLTLLQFLD